MNSAYEVESVRDVLYRSVDGVDLHLDLHLPVGAEGPVPAVAYFHGGGFVEGTRSVAEDVRGRALAARGVAAATFTYRLLDQAPFPAPLEDARAAIAWLREHGAEYGLKTERLGSFGTSAGGYLSTMLGLGSVEAGHAPEAVATVALAPSTDFGLLTTGSWLEEELFPAGDDGGLLGAPYDRTNPAHRALNPIVNVSAEAADFLLITGDRDRVMDAAQNHRLHDALVTAGAQSTFVLVGGVGHEDPAIDGLEFIELIAGFFRARL